MCNVSCTLFLQRLQSSEKYSFRSCRSYRDEPNEEFRPREPSNALTRGVVHRQMTLRDVVEGQFYSFPEEVRSLRLTSNIRFYPVA